MRSFTWPIVDHRPFFTAFFFEIILLNGWTYLLSLDQYRRDPICISDDISLSIALKSLFNAQWQLLDFLSGSKNKARQRHWNVWVEANIYTLLIPCLLVTCRHFVPFKVTSHLLFINVRRLAKFKCPSFRTNEVQSAYGALCCLHSNSRPKRNFILSSMLCYVQFVNWSILLKLFFSRWRL